MGEDSLSRGDDRRIPVERGGRRRKTPASGSRLPRPAEALSGLGERLRCRPAWGGVLTVAAGLALLLLPGGSMAVVLLPGLAGVSGFLFGAGLCVLGLFLLFQPRSHAFAGTAAVLVALASLVTTNIGGFGVGLALGIIGGALGFAWSPSTEPAPRQQAHLRPRAPQAQHVVSKVRSVLAASPGDCD